MKLILASTSSFKSEILNKCYLKHTLKESNFEEKSDKENVYDYVIDLSYGKALSINEEGIILGLDTVVYINNKIIEKPKSIEEIRETLKLSSNNKTSVITGITLYNTYTKQIIKDTCETIVTFKKIDDADIDFYIKNEPYKMEVSGFVFETIMSNFLDKIDGSFYNILGIPVETIYSHIKEMGYNLNDLE